MGEENIETFPCDATTNTCRITVPAPGAALVFFSEPTVRQRPPRLRLTPCRRHFLYKRIDPRHTHTFTPTASSETEPMLVPAHLHTPLKPSSPMLVSTLSTLFWTYTIKSSIRMEADLSKRGWLLHYGSTIRLDFSLTHSPQF